MKNFKAITTGLYLGFVALAAGSLFSANANAGAVIVAFDFENAPAGSSTANASSTGAGITSAVFGGTNPEAEVISLTGNLFSSSALLSNGDGTFYSYFSFTSSSSLELGALNFEAGHNDVPQESRSFEVRLSPAGAPSPAPFDRIDIGPIGWTLLSAIDVSHGLSNTGTPNFNLDLTGITIGPGTYHVAFGAIRGSIAPSGTTLLTLDEVTLTAAGLEVPAPGILVILGLGVLGMRHRGRKCAT